MTFRRIEVENFRNFRALSLPLDPRGGILEAPNGRGKTNFLEAIHYLGLFRSFRGAPDAELVSFGERSFRLWGEVQGGEKPPRGIGVAVEGLRKRVFVDGRQGRPSEHVGNALSVVLSPADIRLVQGSPGRRRRYLDVILALSSGRYLRALQEYQRALKQRNRVLQTSGWSSSPALLEPWTEQLVRHGSVILLGRHRLLSAWKERLGELSGRIAGRTDGAVGWRYESPIDAPEETALSGAGSGAALDPLPASPFKEWTGDALRRSGEEAAQAPATTGRESSVSEVPEAWSSPSPLSLVVERPASAIPLRLDGDGDATEHFAEGLREELARRAAVERRRGATLAGPHRDDLSFEVAGSDGVLRDIRKFGSQGEQRTTALALRFLEAEILTRERGELPVVLLDDVFSELDPERSRELLGLLAPGQQIFMTTPKPLACELDLPRYTVLDGVLQVA